MNHSNGVFPLLADNIPQTAGKPDRNKKQPKIMIIIVISIISAYAAGIYVGRNWKKFTTE